MPRLFVFVLSVAAGAALPSPAGAASIAVCHDGGPGSTAQAKEKLERFLRHMERSAGLGAGSLSGEYHTAREGCEAYAAKAKPAFAVLDLGTLLRRWDDWKLTPIGRVGTAEETRYHVLVRKGSYESLGGLEGKAVVAALPEDEAFLGAIVLEGKAKLRATFTDRPLKALREVAREKTDAAVVGKDAWEHAGELGLPVELVSIHRSEPLPGLTLVSVGANADAALASKVAGALGKLCEGDGAELCKELGVKTFSPAKAAAFDGLRKRYAQ